MNFFGCPDNGPATGANILSGTGTAFAGTLQAKGPGPYKDEPLFSKALNKFKGFRVQGGFGANRTFRLSPQSDHELQQLL